MGGVVLGTGDCEVKGAVVAFETGDVDGFVKMLKDKVVPFVVEPFSTPVCRMAVIKDPDANYITIHQRHMGE